MMQERNKIMFQINNNNSFYSLTTSLIGNKIYLVCKDSNSQIYENNFSVQELLSISKYFQPTHTIEQIQLYLNGIIEKQRIAIKQADEALSINLFLINNDQISIPLLKKIVNTGYNNSSAADIIRAANKNCVGKSSDSCKQSGNTSQP